MIRNLVEEHVLSSYASLQAHFPGFCGCAICKGDVLVFALNRIPARYVSTVEGAVVTGVTLDKDQNRAVIDVHLMEGFRKVSLAPRCARARERRG